MKNFLLIGFGQIGRHYFTALKKSYNCQIDIVEKQLIPPFPEDNIEIISFDNLKPDYELAIIATGAQDQFKVLREISTKTAIKNLILEKNISQYKQDLIDSKKILMNSYVNIWFAYSKITSFLIKKNLLINNISIKISDKTLLSNSIHYLYFIIKIANSELKTLIFSKASNYFSTTRSYAAEIHGEISGCLYSGVEFSIQSLVNTTGPTSITISTRNYGLILIDMEKFVLTINGGKKIQFKEWLISLDFARVVKDLDENRRILYPRVDEVARMQLMLYEAIEKVLGKSEVIPFA